MGRHFVVGWFEELFVPMNAGPGLGMEWRRSGNEVREKGKKSRNIIDNNEENLDRKDAN